MEIQQNELKWNEMLLINFLFEFSKLESNSCKNERILFSFWLGKKALGFCENRTKICWLSFISEENKTVWNSEIDIRFHSSVNAFQTHWNFSHRNNNSTERLSHYYVRLGKFSHQTFANNRFGLLRKKHTQYKRHTTSKYLPKWIQMLKRKCSVEWVKMCVCVRVCTIETRTLSIKLNTTLT